MPALRRPALAAALALTLVLAPRARAVDPNLRIHADEFALQPLTVVTAAQRVEQVPLATLTTQAAATGAALESLSSWTFLPQALSTTSVAQAVPLTSQWTCYLSPTADCGYEWPGNDVLTVTDTVQAGVPTRSSSALEYDAASDSARREGTSRRSDSPSRRRPSTSGATLA